MSLDDPSADKDTVKMKLIFRTAAVLAILAILTASAILNNNIDPYQGITRLTPVPLLEGFKRVSEDLVMDLPMSLLIDPEASKHRAHEARMRLEWYIKDLRGFVINAEFDYHGFEKKINKFRHELADIEFMIESGLNHKHDLGTLMVHARRMYQFWVDSADKLNRYVRSEIPGHAEIFEMIQLNVQVVVLHTPEDFIERQNESHKVRVKQVYCKYLKVHTDFNKNALVPLGMRAFFRYLVSIIKPVLDTIKTQAEITDLDDTICAELFVEHKSHGRAANTI
ncbi:hypothetical protein HF325_002226 [Metschnikowia pulcherrima]|uniref:Uncharacterized protein n=1 Tax=Metschnikowia pulcherrima TaxID=27326 RepID=A0A8H7LAM4_9ASCO|nr:hypothetical protein HF325_002226 [Metschnikowia pulcherrima]